MGTRFCRQTIPVRTALLAAALAGVALLPTAARGQASQLPADRPAIQAIVIHERVDLDGVLDEPLWQLAQPGSGFLQREPDPGDPATEATQIRVVYDDSTLYIGIIAFDSDPGAIVAKEMRRDGQGGGGGGPGGTQGAYRDDDSVAIVLDTFLDRRNAFYFETNPTGARADALVENEGNTNFQWDGVWDAAGHIADWGWSAEIAIPFSTLRFDPAADTWGLNVRRLIRRKNEQVFWAPIGLDANLVRVSLAGSVTGMRGLQPGINLRIKPYATGSTGTDYIEPELSPGEEIKAGLDLLRWGMADNLTLDVTANTDFAQVEADDQRVNLTRFSLFFPEKREFFLENAGIFDFGPTGRSGGGFRPPPLRIFHSRRIGIASGGIVPIVLGARFTGRAGDWNFGLMDVQTSRQEFPSASDPEDRLEPSTNWAIARVKRNVGERSTVGAIFTNKQIDSDNWNRVLGIDADINPSQRINLTGFVSASRDGGVPGTGWAGGLTGAWRGSIWRANAGYMDIRDQYNPEMGFLLRGGVRRYNYQVEFEPRPVNRLGIRNLTFETRADIVTSTDGTLESVDAALRFFGFDMRSGDRVTFFGGYQYERLFEPFEIWEGIVLDPGDYEWTDIGAFVRTDGSRAVSFFGFYTKGSFWNGDRFRGRSELTLRLGRYFSAETNWSFNNVDLPEGSFSTTVIGQRINLAFSPNLFWNTFVQYNSADSLVTLNSRFNWIYKPGADIFLVYNQDWGTGDDSGARNRAIIFKFTYLFML